MSRDDFDWNDNSNVVLRAYGSIAVHENPNGDVVVRQERDALEDEDRFVAIPVQDAEYVAHAIIRKANEIKSLPADERQAKHEGHQPQLALPAPHRPTVTKPREGARHG
jgi:hypothetical protein